MPLSSFDTIKFSAAAMQRLGRDAASEKIVNALLEAANADSVVTAAMGSRPTRRRARHPVRPAGGAAHVPALLSVHSIAVA